MARKGNLIKRLMAQKGWEQKDLVRLSGIAQSNMSEMLADKRDVSKANAVKLARIFGTSSDVFLDADAETNATKSSKEDILLNFELLRDILQLVEEQRDLTLTPVHKAHLIATLYEMANKRQVPDAETVRIIAKLASARG